MVGIVPVELLLRIFSLLDVIHVVRCRLLCRHMCEAIDADPDIMYRIELSVTGLEDNPHSRLDLAEKRGALPKHQRAWQYTHPTSVCTWADEHFSCALLSGGIWAQMEGRTCNIRQLPSELRNIPGVERRSTSENSRDT
ncbi:hypothetical protein OBBRIDRAFT_794234 [Obba rivulosa]|uniref:F-box domain-containing protein n=1 Tax=Obba rivulosa TaxID=1052685 RepID=A0A8E2DJW9_9APHY|nr:hypothetical protein OBBRIDRAFT_794234 [Obba rivulosa]